jgi:hypothetical protein
MPLYIAEQKGDQEALVTQPRIFGSPQERPSKASSPERYMGANTEGLQDSLFPTIVRLGSQFAVF